MAGRPAVGQHSSHSIHTRPSRHSRRILSMRRSFLIAVLLVAGFSHGYLRAAESIWLEAEHLDGITGYCWPLGKPTMKKTDGHWGLSGPGWAAEWNQGGESGFLSIATGADDDRAVVTKQIEIPSD